LSGNSGDGIDERGPFLSLADFVNRLLTEGVTGEKGALEVALKPESKAWGAPVYLTQADLLQAIGAGISARSDTFVVRAYGETVVNGQVRARAWCEAIVQRFPEPIRPDASGVNPQKGDGKPDFGRRFKIKSFRWLNRNEI